MTSVDIPSRPGTLPVGRLSITFTNSSMVGGESNSPIAGRSSKLLRLSYPGSRAQSSVPPIAPSVPLGGDGNSGFGFQRCCPALG